MSNQSYFIIRKGSTFNRRIEYLVDGNPRDLTGYSAKMQFRPTKESNDVFCTLSSSLTPDGTGLNLTPYSSSIQLPLTSGSIGIIISAYSSSQLPNNQDAYFDLFLISGSGINYYSEFVFEGRAKFVASATR